MKPSEGRSPAPVLEIGGSHATSALVDLERGAVCEEHIYRLALSPSGSAEEILAAVIACGRRLEAGPGQRWGVALPGPFDYARGVAWYQGVGKFESLYGLDVGRALAKSLPGPPGPVIFLNDAHAFLWGERSYGNLAGYRRCVAITLGTGIGSAFLADGEVCQSGADVPPQGRVDLLKIEGRPLEEVVSTRAVQRDYRLRTGRAVAGTAEVAGRARSGEAAALDVLRHAFVSLGQALRPWLQRFRAEAVVVGGSMTGSWDLIGPALREGLGADGAGTGVRVSVAAHPEDAPLLGAAVFAQGRQG